MAESPHNNIFDDIEMVTDGSDNVDSQGNFAYEVLDDIDEAMSQMGEFNENVDSQRNFASEALDDIDEAMSQMGEFNGDSAEAPEAIVMDRNYNRMGEASGDETDGDDINGDGSDITPEILAQYEEAMGRSMPKKSVRRYELMYELFLEWQKQNKTRSFDEKVLVAYFSSIAKKYAPTTLWSRYSMLKKTLICKNNVDISNYKQLLAWLKQNSDGYECKQSNIFEPKDIAKFVVEAPNEKYLAMKAILGIGVLGVCRGDELTKLTVDNIRDTGEEFIFNIPTTKTKVKKMYVIEGEFVNIIRQYIKLRPPNVPTDRFFVQYRNGKCTCQVIGKNMIAKVPKEMAKFLKLPNPDSYTGHSYRRTGTTIAANSGASLEELKRIGDWKSSTVCEKYIQESVGHKRKLGRFISEAIDLPSAQTGSTFENINLPDTANIFAMPKTRRPMTNIDNCALASAPSSTVSAGASQMQQPIIVSAVPTSSKSSNSDAASSAATYGSFGINVPGDKQNVVFHFGGECSKFTIINMK